MKTSFRTILSRRSFLESLGVVGSTAFLPNISNHITSGKTVSEYSDGHSSDPDLSKLSSLAIDAALSAGGSYADVRITRTVQKQLSSRNERNINEFAAGIRVLANGTWGFAAHTSVNPDTMAWLGATSAHIAKASTWPNTDPTVMAPSPSVKGTWETPNVIDPFELSSEQRYDTLQRLQQVTTEHDGVSYFFQANFERQDRHFTSSEGSSINQRVYTTFNPLVESSFFEAKSVFSVRHKNGSFIQLPTISPIGGGWENFANLEKDIPAALEQLVRLGGSKPLDQPGRYDVVFDGAAVASFVSVLGQASELDRVLGFEASSGKHSFMMPVSEKLGHSMFPPAVTITANRNMLQGAASIAWDDEGVAPSEFTIIKDGTLVDYATGRELVPEMVNWYKSNKLEPKSYGCMTAAGARFTPVISSPNLSLMPSTTNTTFDDLISDVKHGFAILGGSVDMDNRLLTGWGVKPIIYLIENGKMTTAIRNATYTFNMLDHWKHLVALGGPKTVVMRGFTLEKGLPYQRITHSVKACAARFKDVVIRSVGLSRAI